MPCHKQGHNWCHAINKAIGGMLQQSHRWHAIKKYIGVMQKQWRRCRAMASIHSGRLHFTNVNAIQRGGHLYNRPPPPPLPPHSLWTVTCDDLTGSMFPINIYFVLDTWTLYHFRILLKLKTSCHRKKVWRSHPYGAIKTTYALSFLQSHTGAQLGGGPTTFHTLAKDMFLNRGATQFTLRVRPCIIFLL